MAVSTEDILARFAPFGEVECLGVGGQKAVFAVAHPEFGECVLKVGTAESAETAKRIRREIDLLKELDSSYYPKHYVFEELGQGQFFSLEERIHAPTLEQAIDGYADSAKATWFLNEAVRALSILWERRVIHRDFKPANVLAQNTTRLWVIDLGIARQLDEESITHTLARFGPCTPIYAAPEQLVNRKTDLNHRADQFAIGISVGQLLLGGRHPFDPNVVGTGSSTVENILSSNWARTEVSDSAGAELMPIIETLLGVEPYMRYRTPKQLIDALAHIGGGE